MCIIYVIHISNTHTYMYDMSTWNKGKKNTGICGTLEIVTTIQLF